LKKLRGWLPIHPVLAAAPGDQIYTPPPCVRGIGEKVTQGFRRRTILSLVVFGFMALLIFLDSILTRTYALIPWGVIVAGVAIISGVDYFFYLRRPEFLVKRSQFFFWAHTNKSVRFGFLIWLTAMFIMGFIQWILNNKFSFEITIERYGLIYASVKSGELWRVITGPFFHSGPAHFINNALCLLFLGPILWARINYLSLLVFLFGNICGALAPIAFGGTTYDAYPGVSGGVFAFFGYLITDSILTADLLPPGLPLLIVGITTISAVGAELLSPNAASLAHMAGFICGVLCSGILARAALLRANLDVV
jgi:membrane associated rhomboid family serine protease